MDGVYDNYKLNIDDMANDYSQLLATLLFLLSEDLSSTLVANK
jgi:hypothetical protein